MKNTSESFKPQMLIVAFTDCLAGGKFLKTTLEQNDCIDTSVNDSCCHTLAMQTFQGKSKRREEIEKA